MADEWLMKFPMWLWMDHTRWKLIITNWSTKPVRESSRLPFYCTASGDFLNMGNDFWLFCGNLAMSLLEIIKMIKCQNLTSKTSAVRLRFIFIRKKIKYVYIVMTFWENFTEWNLLAFLFCENWLVILPKRKWIWYWEKSFVCTCTTQQLSSMVVITSTCFHVYSFCMWFYLFWMTCLVVLFLYSRNTFFGRAKYPLCVCMHWAAKKITNKKNFENKMEKRYLKMNICVLYCRFTMTWRPTNCGGCFTSTLTTKVQT